MPLFKDDGSQLDPDNYRLLAISLVVSKLFEKILDSRNNLKTALLKGLSTFFSFLI
jgi:hypothetical protein